MSNQEFETLLFTVDDDGIATLVINRPDKLNALNNLVLDELQKAFRYIRENNSVKGVILTGHGEKAFVAGADIKELSVLGPKSGRKASEKGQDIFNYIEETPKPVIALVNGYALGGGCELAMACHIRIATDNAIFGLPEVSLGLIPGYGGTQRLTRLVGKGRAMEMILTGTHIQAQRAFETGLANQVVPASEGYQTATEMMRLILKKSPVAVSKAIHAVNTCEYDRDEGYKLEASHFGTLCGTSDFKEGVSAFLEKRKAKFTGN
ncbi:MAG: enoyl-CoA hydratase [Balneolaceae bacterium]|nr:MAG: enoyl-CoA hydratase [Balneolaceae bacterium]